MSKPNKPQPIPISSQADDDRYNKKSAAQKLQKMGASRLVMRMYQDDES